MKTILVVIPHEDDEINVAGATIHRFRQEGKRVICVFVTNGDWLYPAEVRMKEALASLAVLGVPAEDAIFLGYPDGGVQGEKSLFMHGQDKVMTIDGRDHTYGSDFKPDFATETYGHPSSYTWENLLHDLEQVIWKYKPQMIIGTDFDNHPDHRMTSIALDTAMGRILNRPGNDYTPLYLKGFAYSIAYEGKDDFFGPRLLSSKVNEKELTYPEFGSDDPAFPWEARIRFPVPEDCRTMDLSCNVIYKALCSYISQRIFVRAGRIINGDQVFWQRRTDNLAHQGRVSVSSGRGKYLHDFQMIYTEDISVVKPAFTHYAWTPDEGDGKSWCRVDFDAPRQVESISFWGNIEEENQILSGELVFSNGYRYGTGTFRKQGRETVIPIEPQEGVTWIEFHVGETKGRGGIAEWGIYGKEEHPLQILGILCNGEMAYDWCIWPGEKTPEISAYAHGIRGDLHWKLDGEEKSLPEIQKCCQSVKRETCISVEADGLTAEMRLLPKSTGEKMLWLWKRKTARLSVRWQRWKQEPKHHALKKAAKKQKRRQS